MLKNLEKNIPSFYKELGLDFTKKGFEKISDSIKKEKRFFTTAVRDKKGEKFFLKVRLQKNKEVIRDFKKEIAVYKLFEKHFKKKSATLPRIISLGKYRNLQWSLAGFIEGDLAGWADKDFGFKKKFLENSNPKDLAKEINRYRSIPFNEIKKLKLYHQGSWWYWQDFNFYLKNYLKRQSTIKRKEIEKSTKILKKRKELLEREAKFLCHGDLYPNNLIITPSNKIPILDWGRSNFNNPSFDIAFIYLNAWKNKKWQESFLNHCFTNQNNKEKFKELFQVSLISITIRLSARCYKYPKNKQAILALKNHIKKLRIALSNLDKIL